MDLNTVANHVALRSRGDISTWSPQSAWLAGGTWLFSEPQTGLETLLDLTTMNWPAIAVDERGVSLAATCTFAALAAYAWPAELTSMACVEPSCRALLGSFKVWNMATVGGNICLALAASPMTALATALEGAALIWRPDGSAYHMRVEDLVVGPGETALGRGELVRAIEMPMSALRRTVATRRASLTSGGRSAAFLIGTRDAAGFAITITASTPRPYRLTFPAMPTAAEMRAAIDAKLPLSAYYDDVHGRPGWRQRMTRHLTEELRAALAAA